MTGSPLTIPESKRLEGRPLAQSIQKDVARRVHVLKSKDVRPSLHVILVGEDPASHVYVRNKQKACEDVGFVAKTHLLPATTKAAELETLIRKLNDDAHVHGILLQLPLPAHLNPTPFLELVDPLKDVDGFHPHNVGLLWGNRVAETFAPCTAVGVLRLLDHYHITIAGRHAVVVGQSQIVGRPVAGLLLARHATVTICHSQSKPLESYTKHADILVVATGKRHLINASHVKEGCVVVDVGIHRTESGLTGDVDMPSVLPKVSAITPVPGGVGPMTIACLVENTWKAYERLTKNSSV
jgi:methylenetetrahydrofolate dehydrogenase (NADP+)/methenyltetrahydrofolate cyclohydrolase